MPSLIYLLLAIASIGFIGVLTVHLAALFGFVAPFQHGEKLVFPTLFFIWLPMIFYMNRLTRDFKQKDLWKAALRGCPKWMRTTLWVIFGYSWVGSIAVPLFFGKSMDSRLFEARLLSGVMLGFYAVTVCVLYSSTQASKFDESRRCLNGHRVGPLAKFCDECGAPVAVDILQPSERAR
jgi:hypothetical protein